MATLAERFERHVDPLVADLEKRYEQGDSGWEVLQDEVDALLLALNMTMLYLKEHGDAQAYMTLKTFRQRFDQASSTR